MPRAAARGAHTPVVQRIGDVRQAPDAGGLYLRATLPATIRYPWPSAMGDRAASGLPVTAVAPNGAVVDGS